MFARRAIDCKDKSGIIIDEKIGNGVREPVRIGCCGTPLASGGRDNVSEVNVESLARLGVDRKAQKTGAKTKKHLELLRCEASENVLEHSER